MATTADNIPEVEEIFRASISSVSDSLVSVVSPDSAVIQIVDEDGEHKTHWSHC